LPHTQGTQGISGNFQTVENLRETQGISGKLREFWHFSFNSGKLREVLIFSLNFREVFENLRETQGILAFFF